MTNTIFSTQELWEDLEKSEKENLIEEIENNEIGEMTESEIEESALDGANNIYYDVLTDCIDNKVETIQDFIERYEKRYNTSISHVAFIGSRSSHYGSIGGAGVKVGRMIATEDLQEVFYGEEFSISITDNNTLQLSTHDHDGSNHMEMILITANESEAVETKYEGYQTHEDYLIYLDEKGKQPTRLDKAFTRVLEREAEAV